jgi:hypothetical protein
VVLYLVLIASPALHQLHQFLEHGPGPCQNCPASESGWRIFSHPVDQPCSDPDHHHHPRPAHDEDHCLSCRLSGAAVGVLPFVGDPIEPIRAGRLVAIPTLVVPLSPERLTMSPRAPPHPTSA